MTESEFGWEVGSQCWLQICFLADIVLVIGNEVEVIWGSKLIIEHIFCINGLRLLKLASQCDLSSMTINNET